MLSHSGVSDSLWPHGRQPTRLLCPWDSPGKDTGVGIRSFLQEIFPNHGSNPGLLHWRWILYWLSHEGSTEINFNVIAGLWVLIVKKGKWKSLSCVHVFTTSRSVLWWVTQKVHSELGSFQLITGGKRGLAVWRTPSCGPVIIPCPTLSTYFSTSANETFNRMCIHTLYHYVKYQLHFILNMLSKQFLALYDNLSACQCRRQKRCGLNPWVGKIPWRRKWLLTPVWLAGKFHARRRLAGRSPRDLKDWAQANKILFFSFLNPLGCTVSGVCRADGLMARLSSVYAHGLGHSLFTEMTGNRF